MKQIILTFSLISLALSSLAQLPNASVSPDFNFFDINGKQHHLYSYLNQGKIVILNFSPAWCQECWNYHRINALKDFYTLYGPSGTNQARVIFIEKDETMELSDLQGITTATAGDWITGTPYPIIDTSAANAAFMPDALPTIYGIYPNKFLANIGRLTTDELFTFMQEYTGPTVKPDTMIKVTLEQMKSPSCAFSNDGALAISVAGPATSYKFAWNNADTTPNIDGLLQGVYRCTITDNLDNVHIIDPISLNDPDTLSLTFLQNTPTSETANNGSIIASVTGGTMPYNYIWSTGGMENTIENLGEGSYSLQVSDANGCQIGGSSQLTIPDCSVVVSINVEATSCDENPDGAVTILIDGATPPVTFAWSNGAMTQSLTNVPSGGYELTVTDAIGCQAKVGAMVSVDDRTRPVARIRQGPIRLYLNAEGLVEIKAAQIDSGSFDNCGILDIQLEKELFNCNDLGRNFVEFTVIDKNLNLSSRDAEILILDTLAPYYMCTENITLAACDGVVSYAPPRAIDNCPEGSRSSFQGIGSGGSFPLGTSTETYLYVAGDGTRLECSFDVTVEKKIDAVIQTRDASCPGLANGSATVSVDSDEPYTYRWSDGQTTQSAVNLKAGGYMVTVSSANECTFEKNFFIGEPSEIFIRLDSIRAEATSNIYITVLGGTPPYRYEWTTQSGNPVTMIQDPRDLDLGTYQIKVTDANGCLSSSTIKADMSTPTNDFVFLKGLELGPNPSEGSFNLHFKNGFGKTAQIEIYSLTGYLLYTKAVPVFSLVKVDLKSITSGFYLVTIEVAGERLTKRLVVK